MANLPTATLGRTGLEVTRLGFGAMELRAADGDRGVSDDWAMTVLNTVLDSGINFIDTSVDYGVSEERIGASISHRRDEFVLATKCGCPATPAAIEAGEHVYTRENIEAAVNQSLKRMNTDYVDIVQFHGSPAQSVIEENDAINTLLDLKSAGKIRFISSSSTLPNIRDHIDMGVFDSFQIPYSALQREHENIIAQSAAAGIGTVIRGGVAKGEPGVSGVTRKEAWETFDKANLGELLEDGESRTAFILRFTLAHPDMHTTIVGTLNFVHLNENVKAAMRGPLSDDVYAEAKRRLDAAGETAD
jgi:aryl-alcohol dehydrogenase-like predicted oxidoreductase